MLDDMTAASFSEHLNTKFRIPLSESDALELELISVDAFESSDKQERFSLIFKGPLDRGVYQGLHNFEHDELGSFSLFIVPLTKDEDGVRYEAVFNRLKKP